MLILFPSDFVKNTRRSPAMPAFFALSEEKIIHPKIVNLLFDRSLTCFNFSKNEKSNLGKNSYFNRSFAFEFST